MEQEPFEIAKRLREDEHITMFLLERAAFLLEAQARRIISLNEIISQDFTVYLENKQRSR